MTKQQLMDHIVAMNEAQQIALEQLRLAFKELRRLTPPQDTHNRLHLNSARTRITIAGKTLKSITPAK